MSEFFQVLLERPPLLIALAIALNLSVFAIFIIIAKIITFIRKL